MSLLCPAFIAQGYASYFICTNKGFDLSVPKALDLSFPNKVPTPYVLTFTFVMPAPTKSGDSACTFMAWTKIINPMTLMEPSHTKFPCKVIE
jgi:hypothetical protein